MFAFWGPACMRTIEHDLLWVAACHCMDGLPTSLMIPSSRWKHADFQNLWRGIAPGNCAVHGPSHWNAWPRLAHELKGLVMSPFKFGWWHYNMFGRSWDHGKTWRKWSLWTVLFWPIFTDSKGKLLCKFSRHWLRLRPYTVISCWLWGDLGAWHDWHPPQASAFVYLGR